MYVAVDLHLHTTIKIMNRKTLRIHNFPPDLSDQEKEDLMVHFGAMHVKVLTSRHKKNSTVFATFQLEAEAEEALLRLHQLDVLGHCLIVEYARGDVNKDSLPEKKQIFQFTKHEKERHYETFLHKLNTWNSGMAFTQPPPAHIRYQYPPPTHAVLANIIRALASVPKFYTQVLHLMNKMNLPSPFESNFPDTDIPVGDTLNIPVAEHQPAEPTSSDEESEIESDKEENKVPTDVVPQKRTQPQSKKKVKRPKFFKPSICVPTSAVTKTLTKPEDVFEKVDCDPVHSKIELKLVPVSTAPAIPSSGSGGFGLMFPACKDASAPSNESPAHEEKKSSTISAEELAANRLSSRDQKHLSVFKSYQPGIPSCRLYIKNLAKYVEERDLHNIYSRYILPDYEEQGSMFDIRLMKEGRMKGQAFITLQNTKQAQLALDETNGYILKNKPMVVQFARSAKAKEK